MNAIHSSDIKVWVSASVQAIQAAYTYGTPRTVAGRPGGSQLGKNVAWAMPKTASPVNDMVWKGVLPT